MLCSLIAAWKVVARLLATAEDPGRKFYLVSRKFSQWVVTVATVMTGCSVAASVAAVARRHRFNSDFRNGSFTCGRGFLGLFG
jgi:hypothetical protein